MINAREAAYGPGDTFTAVPKATSTWKRFSLTFTTASIYSSYYISLYPTHQSVPNAFVYVDDIQLEEGGSATAYVPARNVEIGADRTMAPAGFAWQADQTVAIPFVFANYTGGNVSKIIRYEIRDYWNALVSSGRVDVTTADAIRTFVIAGPSGTTGSYRVTAWVDGMNGTAEEIVCSVVPVVSSAPDGMFGTHVVGSPYWANLAALAGFKWNRTLSVGRQFRWSEVEPTENAYVWHDAEIAAYRNAGLNILAVVGNEVVHVPAWARDANGMPIISKWRDFCEDLATHYRSNVDHWEIWNEPEAEGGLPIGGQFGNPALYADLLENAAAAIRANDPGSTIVAMTTYDAHYMNAVIADTGTNDFDIVSTHFYPDLKQDVMDRVLTIRDANNLTIWNTESGMRSDSFYQTVKWEELWVEGGNPDDFGRAYDKRINTEVRNVGRSIGYTGFKKYFYYDARATGGPDWLISFSIFEWDGTLRPKGVAFAVLASLLDGSTGTGAISTGGGVEAWGFSRANDSIVMIRSATNDYRTLSIPQTAVAYDVMGRIVPSAGLAVGPSALYVVGKNMPVATLAAGISPGAIVADTVAPNLSIVSWPESGTFSGSARLRWFAWDNVSENTRWALTANSILYSYKLVGVDPDWSPWQTKTWIDYSNTTGGTAFHVRAKDAAGNIASIVVVGSPGTELEFAL